MARVYAITNQKGGVGKTTLAFHLAHLLVEKGRRILLLDLDTQANLTSCFLAEPPQMRPSDGAAQIFAASELDVLPVTPSLDLLAGHQYLDGADREDTMRQAVARTPFVRSLPYDDIIIDTPPSLGPRHLSPLLWADHVVIPTEPNGLALSGLNYTLASLTHARRLNPTLRFSLVINKYVSQSKRLQRHYIELLRARAPIVEPYLTFRIALAAAVDARLPIWRYPGAKADLRSLWRQLCEALHCP